MDFDSRLGWAVFGLFASLSIPGVAHYFNDKSEEIKVQKEFLNNCLYQCPNGVKISTFQKSRNEAYSQSTCECQERK